MSPDELKDRANEIVKQAQAVCAAAQSTGAPRVGFVVLTFDFDGHNVGYASNAGRHESLALVRDWLEQVGGTDPALSTGAQITDQILQLADMAVDREGGEWSPGDAPGTLLGIAAGALQAAGSTRQEFLDCAAAAWDAPPDVSPKP